MKAVFGLGNNKSKYNNTRHNVGFFMLDQITKDYKLNKKLLSLIHKKEECLYIKPTVLMNNSGQAVSNVVNYFDIDTQDILIIHDDMDQRVGGFKIVKKGGSGGHKGIKDIIEKLGTNKFKRLKIGVAPEFYDPSKHKAKDFVLKKFLKGEIEVLERLFEEELREIIKC